MVAATPPPPPHESKLGIAALRAMRDVREGYKAPMERYVTAIHSGNLPELGDAYSLSAALCGLLAGLLMLEQINEQEKK